MEFYYTTFHHEKYPLTLVFLKEKLVGIYSRKEDLKKMQEKFPQATFKEDDLIGKALKQQLTEYFNGHRQTFDIPYVFIEGTSFQQTVWQTLAKVPYGKTVTYSQLASLVDRPKAVRAVASSVGHNPLTILLPCHRILPKDKKQGVGKFSGAKGMKSFLLHLEDLEKND